MYKILTSQLIVHFLFILSFLERDVAVVTPVQMECNILSVLRQASHWERIWESTVMPLSIFTVVLDRGKLPPLGPHCFIFG